MLTIAQPYLTPIVSGGGLSLVDDSYSFSSFDPFPQSLAILANDIGIVGGEVLTVDQPPSVNWTVSVNPDGVRIDFNPGFGFSGNAVFTYDVNSSGSPATVTVNLSGGF
jgi:hypothetical protein